MENSRVTYPSHPGSKGVTFTIIPHLAYVDFPRQITNISFGILNFSTVLASTNEFGGIIHSETFLVTKIVGLEFSNTTPLPAKIYANEGVAQFIFLKGNEKPEVTYADRKGKYMGQTGVTLPKV